ncbi:hypothetical protein VPH159E362A_0064 [Vibrio phage 159E36-2a]
MTTPELSFFEIDAKHGSSDDMENVFVCETDNGTWWYCVDGGENVNETTIEPTNGCDLVSDMHDIDCFTLEINSLSQFEEVMIEHLTPETVDRAVLTIEIDSINSAFQDGNAQSEVIRILKECIRKVEGQNFDACNLRDVNGNSVGDFYLNIESEEV